jgi:asparagine synthase (glutamine-hydrolysing)
MVDRMLDAQAIYGGLRRFAWHSGDHFGSQPHDRIALGGNLMHLLPEDSYDKQPLWNSDHSACLVAEVRLDNRADLILDLGLVHPDELADSAILMAAWERWGESLLDHIIGGFAFAVWTPARRTLFAARDHSGERPLFYHRGTDFFALASMPKGLLALPGVFTGMDERRVADNLANLHPDRTRSCFQGIARVPLGHLVRVTPDSFECRPYWHPADAKPTRFKRDEEYVEALLDLLDQAVRARLRSPKSIASQLSAGLDSSSVAATAARLLGSEGRRLTTFTSVPRPQFHGRGLPGKLPSEGPGAADVAAMYSNIDHVPIDSAGMDLLADMKAWTDAMDEPAQNCVNLLWISAIMAEAKRRGAGVMLHGTLGNATVSADGYEALTTYFRGGRWLKMFEFANNMRNRGEFSFKASAVLATNGIMPLWMKLMIKPGAREVTLDYTPAHPRISRQYKVYERVFELWNGDLPSIQRQRELFFERFDFAHINGAVRARYGIDQRDPLGDKRIFDFCYSLPIDQYAAGGQSRSLVRRAMRGRLPEATLARTKRGQQGADWYLTVGEALPSLREELSLIEGSPVAQHFLDVERLKRLAETWPESGYETRRVTDSWNYALTRGTAVGYFLRTHDPAAIAVPGEDQKRIPAG